MAGARSAVSPPHLALRTATRHAHEAAEASPMMRSLVAGELDDLGYERLLAAQWTLLSRWEAERSAWLDTLRVLHGWPYASRAAALRRDLMATGIQRDHLPELRQTAVPSLRMPADDALPAALGELYVIEGSALGGRVIVKGLRERLPHLPHHFYAIGEGTAAPWRRFQSLLDDVLTSPASLAAAIDAARHMFARFQQTLQDSPAHV